MIRKRRLLLALAGSAASGVVGLLIGMAGAGMYSSHYYPNDPDPVDFTIGGIFFALWCAIWLIGTLFSIGWAFRRR